MSVHTNERRPRAEAASNGNGGEHVTVESTCPLPVDPEVALPLLHGHVAIVEVGDVDGHAPKFRRYVFMSLPAATRAVDRAHARGRRASVYLAELRPIGGTS